MGAIRPNPRQPRTSFDADELAELVYSVQQIGILQPVVVRAAGSRPAESGDQAKDVGYELVMGERRWRAAQAAGLEFVPAIVKQTSDDALLRDALLENLHRTDLNPLEEAAAYQQLLDDFGCTQEELSSRIGRSRPQISNTLRRSGCHPRCSDVSLPGSSALDMPGPCWLLRTRRRWSGSPSESWPKGCQCECRGDRRRGGRERHRDQAAQDGQRRAA